MRQTVVENKNHEDEAARNILAGMGEMPGTTFTFDALHTKGGTTAQVVEYNKADYFTIVKNNTKKLRKNVEELIENEVSDTAESFDKGHGRIERRKLELLCVTPQQMEYPHCHACGKITRVREKVKAGKVVGFSLEEEYFVASHKNAAILGAEFFLHAAREHWAIENKLHHVKDRSMDEDRINIRGGYARIKTGLQSLAALTISASKDSANCVQRRISSNPKSLTALLTCKSLSTWRIAFL